MSWKALVTAAAVAAACGRAVAAPATPTGSPAQSDAREGERNIQAVRTVVIPVGKATRKVKVSGKVTLLAMLPSNPNLSLIVFSVDQTEVGRATKPPYRTEWDSSYVPDGEHVAKWAAISADGTERGTGSANMLVTNPVHKSSPDSPTQPPSVGGTTQPADRPGPAAAPLPQEFTIYSSRKYGIRIEHPVPWSAKDQSASLPRGWVKGYWLVFSTDPIAQATYVVNLRHRLLQKKHTAESLLRAMPYLTDWAETMINGRTAFTTTAGSQTAKRVVHRAMILDGRDLWMMNCIDTSGRPADESKSLFTRMVQSLRVGEDKPAP